MLMAGNVLSGWLFIHRRKAAARQRRTLPFVHRDAPPGKFALELRAVAAEEDLRDALGLRVQSGFPNQKLPAAPLELNR